MMLRVLFLLALFPLYAVSAPYPFPIKALHYASRVRIPLARRWGRRWSRA